MQHASRAAAGPSARNSVSRSTVGLTPETNSLPALPASSNSSPVSRRIFPPVSTTIASVGDARSTRTHKLLPTNQAKPPSQRSSRTAASQAARRNTEASRRMFRLRQAREAPTRRCPRARRGEDAGGYGYRREYDPKPPVAETDPLRRSGETYQPAGAAEGRYGREECRGRDPAADQRVS